MKKSTSFPESPRREVLALGIARVIGAVALLVVGGVHLEQYTVAHFLVIPTIGSLFLLNFIAATAIGLVLLIPIRATVGPPRLMFESLAALAGISVASGAFVGLFISEHTPLFGFMEHGYRLEIVIALAAEAVPIISLGAVVVIARRRSRRLNANTAGRESEIGATPAAATEA
jgi:hypothetical protein